MILRSFPPIISSNDPMPPPLRAPRPPIAGAAAKSEGSASAFFDKFFSQKKVENSINKNDTMLLLHFSEKTTRSTRHAQAHALATSTVGSTHAPPEGGRQGHHPPDAQAEAVLAKEGDRRRVELCGRSPVVAVALRYTKTPRARQGVKVVCKACFT